MPMLGECSRLSELAKAQGITVAQLALAWLLAQGDDVVLPPARLVGMTGCGDSG